MRLLAALVLAGLCAGAQAQVNRDPLTVREVDLMRERAQDSKRRIDLLIGFARDRVLVLEQMRNASRADVHNGGRQEELLEDLAGLIDELDDNLAMYSKHGDDLRRPLRHVLDAEAELQCKLKALDDPATPQPKGHIALEDALDSLQSSIENANAMLTAEIAKRGEEKHKEKLDHQEVKQERTSP
jgi:hypothetical protein